MNPRKNVVGQLAVARSVAERKQIRGESDAFEQGEIGRLSAELERLNKINKEAEPAIAAMDRRGREQQRAEELAAAQRQAREEQTFNEQLQAHYEDRLSF